MNTILTDDERRHLWESELDMPNWRIDGDRVIRAAEAAVLAKLLGQEPVAWCLLTPSGKIGYFDGKPMVMVGPVGNEHHTTPLFPYAAPQPAVVQVPQEFDYKHPRAQALIGADARHRIIIDLVWQILEDPRREFTASDMEYWDKLHDKVQEVALAAAPESPAQGDPLEKLTRIQEELGLYNDKPAQPSVPAPWREAMKLARWALEGWANHGTWVWPESALEQCKRNTTEALAAIALADSLEGGE